MVSSLHNDCVPGQNCDHSSAVFDGEGDVVLYRGCGYKVSGMNTQGIPVILKKPDNFFPYPSVINNTTNNLNVSVTVRKVLTGQDIQLLTISQKYLT